MLDWDQNGRVLESAWEIMEDKRNLLLSIFVLDATSQVQDSLLNLMWYTRISTIIKDYLQGVA
jgi:hypothetical protein